MHTLFNLDYNIQAGITRDPNWTYINDTLVRGLNTFVSYYQNHAFAVEPNHILVKTLQSMPVSRDLSIDKYYDMVDNHIRPLSMSLGFTSSTHKGRIFSNIFYGSNSSEIIIDNSYPFNAVYADKNWKKLSAVKVIRHDRTQLALSQLDGKGRYGKEVAVVAINLPLLFVQYRAFKNYEKLMSGTDDSLKSAMQFIAMYVLPNMQYSHFDYVLFNRFNNLLNNKPNDGFTVTTPFFQSDYSKRVDNVLESALERLRVTQVRFDAMLKNIPATNKENMFEVMTIPNILPTRQVVWALVISRIKVLRTLFLLNDAANARENQAAMNRIIRQAIYYKSDNTLQYGLPSDLYIEVNNTIDELVSIATK